MQSKCRICDTKIEIRVEYNVFSNILKRCANDRNWWTVKTHKIWTRHKLLVQRPMVGTNYIQKGCKLFFIICLYKFFLEKLLNRNSFSKYIVFCYSITASLWKMNIWSMLCISRRIGYDFTRWIGEGFKISGDLLTGSEVISQIQINLFFLKAYKANSSYACKMMLLYSLFTVVVSPLKLEDILIYFTWSYWLQKRRNNINIFTL